MIKNLKHIEVVEGECKDCDFNEVGCEVLCQRLIPESFHNKLFLRKKETWETCTKENTKVGDTVYKDIKYTSGKYKESREYNVKYIHETEGEFLLNDDMITDTMCLFKIKVEG